MKNERILVTGAGGQIGTVLTEKLRESYGESQVIASDIKSVDADRGPFVVLDILNTQRLAEIIDDFKVTQIYHLAAILSANGEWNPLKTWNVNLNAYINLLEVAREKSIHKIFFPSSIAVFGHTTPRNNTPQFTSMIPETIYGISKQTGELWSNYYHTRYQLDIRSLRYPGIIGHQSMPSGGTTDYAVEIFHAAVENQPYTCFLKSDTFLPMIYMPDAIKATIQLMEADGDHLSVRSSYNLSGMSFSPQDIYSEIKKSFPSFMIDYQPDFRQEIADSWTSSIEDQAARIDWAWSPSFDLASMTLDMIHHLVNKK